MQQLIKISLLFFVMVSLVHVSSYADDLVEYDWGIYLGSHYTGSVDYYQRAGEYYRTNFSTRPEFGLNYIGTRNDKILKVNAFYYDDKRMRLNAEGVGGDTWSAKLSYRSFFHRTPHDLLGNMSAREAVDPEHNTPGGKTTTHRDYAPGAEFGYASHEVASEAMLNLIKNDDNGVKLYAAHKSLIENGDQQLLSTSHCFSCHVESHRAEVELYSHNFMGGIEGSMGPASIAYEFGYRFTESRAEASQRYFDEAQHPVAGDKKDEFGSRLIYDDTTLAAAQQPETEKYSHTARLKTDLPFGALAGSFTHARATNKDYGLDTKSNGGVARLFSRLSRKISFVANFSASRIKDDPYFVDLPLWREDRSAGGQDFDYTRYSGLTRTYFTGSGEVIYNPSIRYRLSLLGGYKSSKRDDFPAADAEHETKTLFGQLAIRYRPSSKFSGSIKVRLEQTDNPFMTVGKLLERRMNGVEDPITGNGFVYYFQREDYKYGDATQLPTMSQQLQFQLRYRPAQKWSLVGGLRVQLEKNDDLNTIDFEKTLLQPSLSTTYVVNPNWSLYGNFSHLNESLNAPLAVALFDG